MYVILIGDLKAFCFTYYNGSVVMELTPKESTVVECLRRKRIGTMKDLRKKQTVSHMTVVRALKKYGYHRSVNHNGSYYTLHDVPRFDVDGLWAYREICFSEYGNLGETLVTLVENASAGMTVLELEQRVKTKVGNLLSRLCQQNELTRCFVGRHAVYLAAKSKKQEQQKRQRAEEEQESRATRSSSDTDRSAFPPRCDVVTVLEVLIQIIKTPKAGAAEVANALRARGVKITVVQVQRVFDFYALQKKRNTRRRRSGDSPDR
jgi:hypothetical protein